MKEIIHEFTTDRFDNDLPWKAVCMVSDKRISIKQITCDGVEHDKDDLPHGMIESIKESVRELYEETFDDEEESEEEDEE